MGLADQLIKNIESGMAQTDSAPSGYYVDDLGFYVEEDIKKNKSRYAEYLLFRIKYLHPDIFSHYGKVYCDFVEVRPRTWDILALADSPLESITLAQAVWLYNRIRETALPLSDRYIMVSRDYLFDMEKCALRKINAKNEVEFGTD